MKIKIILSLTLLLFTLIAISATLNYSKFVFRNYYTPAYQNNQELKKIKSALKLKVSIKKQKSIINDKNIINKNFRYSILTNVSGLQINPDTLNISLTCNDSIIIPVTIKNISTINQTVHIPSTGDKRDSVRILVNIIGSDSTITANNTIGALSQYFTKFKLTYFDSGDTLQLQKALSDQDILLYPNDTSSKNFDYYLSRNTVQNFAQSGKRVITCGGTNTSSGKARTYLLGLIDVSQFYQYNSVLKCDIVDTSHFITKQFPDYYISTQKVVVQNFTSADKVKLVDYEGFDVVAYRKFGKGDVVIIGFDYSNPDSIQAKLLANSVYSIPDRSPDWIYMSELKDTLMPGDSIIINLKISSVGLNAGIYDSFLSIYSTDTVQSLNKIAVHLINSGQAQINLSDTCLAFGSFSQYKTKSKNLSISNSGCDTLRISSISSSAPEFSTNISALNIAPGKTEEITVEFNSPAVGNFSGNLILLNNSHDTTICLSGIADTATKMSISPNSLNATLNPCNDSTTLSFYIRNRGGLNLNWEIPRTPDDSVNVGIYTLTVDTLHLFENVIPGINQFFSKYKIKTIRSLLKSALLKDLENIDILILPVQTLGNLELYTFIANDIQEYVNSGGTVLIYGAKNNLYQLGLFSGNYFSTLNDGINWVFQTTDNLVRGVPLIFHGSENTAYQQLTDSNCQRIISGSSDGFYDMVTYRKIGSGKAIDLGWSFEKSNANINHVFANAIQFSRPDSLIPDLNITPTSGNILPGDSIEVFATFKSKGMNAGTYQNDIIINSNDPLNHFDTIKAVLNIGNSICVNFDNIVPSSCSGVIKFRDQSFNKGNTWSWDFGDGSFSTLQNPLHPYNNPGNFQVKFMSCNNFNCDSIVKTISINTIGGPSTPTCAPASINDSLPDYGILNVTLNTINKTSGSSLQEGYQDYTCTDSTTLTEGNIYTIEVTTANVYPENVKAWIDFNNDGEFDPSAELILASNYHLGLHTGTFDVPPGSVLDIPIRLRVGDDYWNTPALIPCISSNKGQFEDYTIILRSHPNSPTANFQSSLVNPCTQTFLFHDFSTNVPHYWSWDFGDGNISFDQHPTHAYLNDGNYTVTLIAENLVGSDTTSQNITVNFNTLSTTITGSLIAGDTTFFNATALNQRAFYWSFGDGTYSNLPSPKHIYLNAGVYFCELYLTTENCVLTRFDTLTITPFRLSNFEDGSSISIFPNPFSDELKIAYHLETEKTVRLEVYDITGRIVDIPQIEIKQNEGDYNYIFKPKNTGVYLVNFSINGERHVYKVISVD